MVNGEAVAPANGDKQTHRNEMFFMTNEQESSSSKSPGVEHGTFFGKPVLSSTFLNENVCILANFSKLMNIIHFTCCFLQNNLQIGRFSGVSNVWCYKIHSNNVKKDLIDTKNVYICWQLSRGMCLSSSGSPSWSLVGGGQRIEVKFLVSILNSCSRYLKDQIFSDSLVLFRYRSRRNDDVCPLLECALRHSNVVVFLIFRTEGRHVYRLRQVLPV